MESITRNQATAALVGRLEDASTNPLTGNAWPNGHANILQCRRQLPVYGRYQEILNKYHQSQVYASGLKIACTQPCRLAATELAGRVAEEMGVKLGEEVGYQIRGDRFINQNDKKTWLMYLTEGVLIRQLTADKQLSAYECVIIDEAHERTADLDVLMGLLKGIVAKRKNFKVVIMSATLDVGLFQKYFNNCPYVNITGRNFNVDVRYSHLEETAESYVVLAASTVVHIHKNEKPGHILVFLPGEDEIRQVCQLVRGHASDIDVFPLHSKLSSSDQRLALNSSGTNRKCIVATNIAETSLTISDVVYVVDSGLSRQMIFNPRLRLNMLNIRTISQASARQRAGRAGRTSNGICYRLYSEKTFGEMPSTTEPSIRRVSLDSVVLRVVATCGRHVIDFDWIDSPHPDSIARAAQDLLDWGMLKDNAALTLSGRRAVRCPLDPIWSRAIEIGATLGCSLDIVEIALLCSSQSSIFLRLRNFEQVADWAKTAFVDTLSDHLTLANAFNIYMRVHQIHEQENGPVFDLEEWCLDHFLDMRVLEAVRNQIQDVERFMSIVKIASTRASDKTTIRKALAIAFCTHTATYHSADIYRTVHENTSALLTATSSLVGDSNEWIVYTSIHMSRKKPYIQIATAILPEWIVDLPLLQDDRLLRNWHGTIKQPKVKESLDAARARINAAKDAQLPERTTPSSS